MGCLRLIYEKESISPLKVVYRETLCIKAKRAWDSNSIDPYEQYHSPYLSMGNNWHMSTDADGGFADCPTCPTGAADGAIHYFDGHNYMFDAGSSTWYASAIDLSAGQAVAQGIGIGFDKFAGSLQNLGTLRGLTAAILPPVEKLVYYKEHMEQAKALADRLKNSDATDRYRMLGEVTTQAVGGALLGEVTGVAAGIKKLPNTPQVIKNQIAGNAYRDEVASFMKANGRDVVTEVSKKTPFGIRYIDIEVSIDGKVLGGIETKTGGSRYLPMQRIKDIWLDLNTPGGYPVQVVRKPK
jgi:hypothetical protein